MVRPKNNRIFRFLASFLLSKLKTLITYSLENLIIVKIPYTKTDYVLTIKLYNRSDHSDF